MSFIDREPTLMGKLGGLPVAYLLGGATVGVWVVHRFHHPAVTPRFVVAFLGVLSVSAALLLLRFDPRFALVLVGAGLLGLHAVGIQHRFLKKRDALGTGTRRLVGVYRGEHRFSAVEGAGAAPVDLYVSDPAWTRGTKLVVSADVQGPVRSEGFRRYLRVQGFHGVVHVEAVHARSPPEGWRRARYGLFRLVDRGLETFQNRWDRSVRFQRALILGQKTALPASVLRLFRRLGVSHLFVISGLHVGILFWLTHRLLEPLGRSPGLIAATAVVFLYVAVLGWPVSATRAALMVGLYCLARVLWRRPDGPALLIGAAGFMFAWDPFVLLDVGFQLSVGAMVGIYAVHRYRSRLRPVPGGDYLLYSTGAFLGVAPLILFYFHYLPRWGVLFGWLGSLLFPLFLFGLCLQTVTMVAGWSALADLGETFLLWTETGVLRSFRDVDLLLTVSDVRVLTVLVLGACIWITVEGDRAVWAQAGAGVAVLVLLLAVALPPTRPHLEVALPNQRPVLFVHNPHGVRALVLSPGVHPGPGEVYSIKRYLRGKGVVELDVLVSSLTRRGLRRLRPGFVVDRLGVHGSGGGAVSWEGGGYDFDHHRLDSYFGSIRYNIQKFEREQPPGSRHTLYCPDTGPCEVGRRPVQTATRGGGTRAAGTPLPIAEDPIRWVSPGRPRTGTRVTQTVEDHLRTFLPGS